MGLTIHYSMRTTLAEPKDVRKLVSSVRQAARGLPFQSVGPVREFQCSDADFEQGPRDDPDRWLKIQAARYLEENECRYSVKPDYIVAFTVDPGDGCEPANFGLCTFPAYLEVTTPQGRPRRLPTQLSGWSWQSFCKTQYASDPRCGGVENFLRCHVGVCRLLDIAQATGLLHVDVNDESHYFERRDPKLLVNTVGEWNQFVAAFAGMFKDQAEGEGVSVEAAITGFPNFEHLEAKGLDNLRRQQRQDD